MTRETKIGLIVAFSFLLLVGGVVFYKLYVTEPTDDDADATASAQAEPKAKRSAEPPKKSEQLASAGADKQVTTGDGSEPPPPEKPNEQPGSSAPPPQEKPGLTGRPDMRPPPLPASPGNNSGSATKPGAIVSHPFDLPASEAEELGARAVADARSEPPPAEAPPPPEDSKPAGRPGRPGFDTPPGLSGRPTFPAGDEKPMPPAEGAARSGASGTGRPTFTLPMNPQERTPMETGRDAGERDAPPPPESGPREGPKFPPTPERPERPGSAEPPVPLSLPPEARGTGETKSSDVPPPVPPSDAGRPPAAMPPRNDAFDRKYDPPANLGRPTPEPSREDDKRGIPVEIRPQPDLASIAGSGAVKDSGNVLIYERELHTVRTGESYATISQLKYGTPKYAEALAMYNREQDARLATLVAGKNVFIPPVEVLEKKYRSAIGGTAEVNPPAEPRRDLATSFNPAGTRPMRDAATSGATEKRYRVRTGDTLWNIAKQSLGNGERWTEIMRMNRDVLPDINRLQDGLILRLPADAKVDSLPPSP